MSYQEAVTIKIPWEAVHIHKLMQDEAYSIADVKIILTNSLQPNAEQKCIYSHSSLLTVHCEYFEKLLSGKYADLGTDLESLTTRE
eukprot:CAMPEP_0117434930 /NCGR_PEP_ID=MMETSP0759-20121206/209_1 /TAXON_ID=63605 /ORGANISM="Percolomonas cosmopolitus, Strain WS" /LENGTH=85 /DNA_ID=CAMNT_0005226441 /DNA_START=1045 /DNA_END=1299 /DNA_ORIENTATION=+